MNNVRVGPGLLKCGEYANQLAVAYSNVTMQCLGFVTLVYEIFYHDISRKLHHQTKRSI